MLVRKTLLTTVTTEAKLCGCIEGKKSQSYDIDFGNHNRNDKIKAEGLKPCCIHSTYELQTELVVSI